MPLHVTKRRQQRAASLRLARAKNVTTRVEEVLLHDSTGLQKRLQLLASLDLQPPVAISEPCKFISSETLRNLAAVMTCRDCGNDSCVCTVDETCVDASLEISCPACNAIVFKNTVAYAHGFVGKVSQVTKGHVRMVFDSQLNSVGYAGFRSTCVRCCLQTLNQKRFYRHVHFLQQTWRCFPRRCVHTWYRLCGARTM